MIFSSLHVNLTVIPSGHPQTPRDSPRTTSSTDSGKPGHAALPGELQCCAPRARKSFPEPKQTCSVCAPPAAVCPAPAVPAGGEPQGSPFSTQPRCARGCRARAHSARKQSWISAPSELLLPVTGCTRLSVSLDKPSYMPSGKLNTCSYED